MSCAQHQYCHVVSDCVWSFHRRRVLSILALLSCIGVPGPAFPAEITTDDSGMIVARGQTTSGCPEEPRPKREAIDGHWLALTETAIQPTQLWVAQAGVASDNSAERFFFKDIPLRVGPIAKARVKPRKVNTTARSEYDVAFGDARYRFIEWGGISFALQTLSPTGKIVKTEVHGEEAIPPKAYAVSAENQDRYHDDGYDGRSGIEFAGDFNGDGIVDFLLNYWVSEASGLILWLSNPETGTRRDSYMSATQYFDCVIDENPD
jgi:hypothetical protein